MDEQEIDKSYADKVRSLTDARVARAVKEAERMAELKTQNLERRRQERAAINRKNKAQQKYAENKELHNQLGLVAGDLLKQFIEQHKGITLVPVGDLRDRDANARRREQIAHIKATMEAASSLMLMQKKLADEHNLKKNDQAEGQADVRNLFKEAEKFNKKMAK